MLRVLGLYALAIVFAIVTAKPAAAQPSSAEVGYMRDLSRAGLNVDPDEARAIGYLVCASPLPRPEIIAAVWENTDATITWPKATVIVDAALNNLCPRPQQRA